MNLWGPINFKLPPCHKCRKEKGNMWGGDRRYSRESRTQLFGRKKGEPWDIDLNLRGRRESNTIEDGERIDKKKATKNA